MSIFSWLFSRARAPKTSDVSSDGLTVPQTAHGQAHPPEPANSMAELKQQRQDHREHLYAVVRDMMLRSEILASHYKFKVLSLDTRGRQFLIMVDLMGPQVLRHDQLLALENLIAMTAAQSHNLMVKAVYWRQSEPAVAAATAPAMAHPPSEVQQPAVQPIVTAPAARVKTGTKVREFEPIGQDEMQAFKKAIGERSSADSMPGQMAKSGPRHEKAEASGFEDTQLLESDDALSPLSGTQFGKFN